MNDELEFTVISDIHYYSKKNFVDGFDKNKKPKPGQLFFSRSEEIVEHTFDCLCKNDTPDIVLISGDLTYNGERTSHDEMKAALKKLQQKGKRVYVITATHDYTTPRMPTYGIDKNDKYIEVESVKRTQLLKYYGDFGYNNAIAKHKSTMSYVAQLADGYRLFFYGKHSAEAATFVYMAGLEHFDAFHHIEQITQFVVIRDVQFAGSGDEEFAHTVAAVVNADFVREACRYLRRFEHIMDKLAEIINLPCTPAHMSFGPQNPGMVFFHKCHATGRRADNVIVLLEQIFKTECQLHRLVFKTGVCHRLSATGLIQRIIDIYS